MLIKITSTPSASGLPELYPNQDFVFIAGNGLQYQEGLKFAKNMQGSDTNINNGTATFFNQMSLNSNDSRDINNAVVIDTLPINTNLTQIQVKYNTPGEQVPQGISVQTEYQTDQDLSWITIPANTIQNQYLDVSILGISLGDRIKSIRYTIPNIPAASLSSNYKTIVFILKGDIISPTDNMALTNCAAASGVDSVTSTQYEVPSCDSIIYKTPVKELKFYFNKRVNASEPASPGESGYVEMRINNNPVDSLPLINPTMYDLLPVGQILDETSYAINSPTANCVSWYCVDAGLPNLPAPIVTKTPNFNNTGRTLLKFEWSGVNSITIDGSPNNLVVPNITDIFLYFKVKFDPALPKTTLINEGFGSSGNTEPRGNNYCVGDKKYLDIYDLNQDGSTADIVCREAFSNQILPPPGSSQLNSTKFAKGDLDSNFSRYPEIGNVTPGGDIDYKISIQNPSSNIKDLDIYDIFPSVGDTGVVSSESRYSVWRPTLKAPINLPVAGIVYYTTAINPCRDAVSPNGTTPFPIGCNIANWSATPPANIEDTTGVRFDLAGYVLANGGNIEINYQMKAPFDPQFSEKVAWNSFGYVSTGEASNVKLLPAEPIKVGIKYKLPVSPKITGKVYLDTDQDGFQDANEPDGNIPIGTTVVITDTTNSANTYNANINSDGTYSQDVLSGTYTITVIAPNSWTISTSTELADSLGPNPSTVSVAATETKSQGKDGLYQELTNSATSSVTSSGVVSSQIISSVITSSEVVSSIPISSAISSQVVSSVTSSEIISSVISSQVVSSQISSDAISSETVSSMTSSEAISSATSSGVVSSQIISSVITSSEVVSSIPISSQVVGSKLKIRQNILIIEDPYVCGTKVIGFVQADTNEPIFLVMIFKQKGVVIKEYKQQIKNGNWEQMLSDLPFGDYDYQVVATSGDLSDSEAFKISHISEEDCKNKNQKTLLSLVRTGGEIGIFLALVITLVLSFVLLNKKSTDNNYLK